MFLSNTNLSTGSMMILRHEDQLKSAGACLRELILSDHLAIYTYIDLVPIKSLRQPRIDKMTMIDRTENLNRGMRTKFRQDMRLEFLKLRQSCIQNTVNKSYSRPEKHLDSAKIQVSLNNTVLLFSDPRAAMPKKTFHNII